MRILVMLAPTNARGTKTAYTKFRKKLVSCGFVMLQAEVYMKVVPNREVARTQLSTLERYAPPDRHGARLHDDRASIRSGEVSNRWPRLSGAHGGCKKAG